MALSPSNDQNILDVSTLIYEFLKNSDFLSNLGNSFLEFAGQSSSEVITNLSASAVNMGLIILGEELIKRRGESSKIRSISKYLGVNTTQYNKNKILARLIDDRQQFEKLNKAVIFMCNNRDFSEIHSYFNKEFGLSLSETFDVYFEIKDIIMDHQTLGSIIEICKKLVSIHKDITNKFANLEDILTSHYGIYQNNFSSVMKEIREDISNIEKLMKDQILSLKLSSNDFELIQKEDLICNGRNNCWLTGIFTHREINNQFDARRSITDDILFSIDSNFGTIVFGRGSFGKSKLAFRLIHESILKENYVVLFTDNVSNEIFSNLRTLIGDLIKKYPKILFVIDDAHKEGIERILSMFNNLFTLRETESYSLVRFLFLAREREFNSLKDTISNSRFQSEIQISMHNLYKIYIPNFGLDESIVFLNKALRITLPTTNFDFVEEIAEFLFNRSDKNLQIFLCNLRQTLSILKIRQNNLPENLVYAIKNESKSEFVNCIQEQIFKKISIINTTLTTEEVDSLLKVLFLRMFGIKLNEHYLDQFDIFRHHINRLSELDLISLDDNEYIHEDAATEFLINLYKKFDNHQKSFDHEYQIKSKMDLIFGRLLTNDILTAINKCEYLYDDRDRERRTFPLGDLVMGLSQIPGHFMKDENKKNLYKIYTHGLGNFYYHIGDYIKSVENHNKAIDIDSLNPDAHDGKGISLSRLGKNKEAIEEYDKALKIDPYHANAHYNKSISLSKLKDDENAIKEFDKAIKYDPLDPDAHYFKALSLNRLENEKGALREFDKATDRDPFYINAYIHKGATLSKLGKDRQAIKEFDKAINIDPEEEYAHFNKALSLSNLGKLKESIIEYDEAIRLNPQNAWAHYNRGSSLMRLNRFEDAIKGFDKTIELDSQNAWAHYNKGISLSILGSELNAIIEFDLALNILPQYVKAYDSKGISLCRLGKDIEAIEEYDKALKIDPTYSNAHFNKALSLSNLGKLKESIIEYNEATKYEPEYANAHYNKAISLDNLGYHEEAVKSLEVILEMDPSHLPALNQLAWIIANNFQQKLPESITRLKKVILENPNISFILYTYAYCLDKIKQYKEAINAYERVILADPDFADAYYDCARSLIKLDPLDIGTCIEYLKKAIRLDPELKEKAKSDIDFQSIKNKFELNL